MGVDPVSRFADQVAGELANEAARADLASAPSAVARLEATRVDLVDMLERGLPPRPMVPGSSWWHVGKRHLVAAGPKNGKSLVGLVHAVDVIAAGGSVVILDRENGAEEYARRLGCILGDRNGTTREAVRERLHYHEWPNLRLEDGADAEFIAALRCANVVIFDASRPWLSLWALNEDKSDDYARFMAELIDPLARAGPAVVVLDNTGHDEKGRARGSSSKGDLHDLTFTLRKTKEFSEEVEGKVLITPQLRRFSPGGPWDMRLGRGVYSELSVVGARPPVADAHLLGQVRELIEAKGGAMSGRSLFAALRGSGRKFRDESMRDTLAAWVADPGSGIDSVDDRYVANG